MTISTEKPVLVTGATGYLAGWIIEYLLRSGVTVHAAVRNPNDEKKLNALNNLAAKHSGTIHYFKSNLLEEGSYLEAMKGCSIVFHTASPFILKVKDNHKDLIDPAVNGTSNVLNSANQIDSVERIILTSSCASIYGDNIDLKKTKNGIFTEEDWNTSSSANHQAYSYSKVMAERKAWEIEKQQSRWKLIVINPSLIIGPSVSSQTTSASFDIIRQMGDGTMKIGVPEFNIGAVDVRDVAEAHVKAAYLANVEGRHIVSAENTSFMELAGHLKDEYDEAYPFPKKLVPKFIAVLFAPASGLSMKAAKRSIGHPWKADHSKSIQSLGLEYRPLNETTVEMFQQMIDNDVFKK